MRLALLCDDATVVPWLDAIASDPTHEVVLAVTLSPRCAEILRGRSGIRLTPHWEDLLAGKGFDTILVGGSDPTMLEAIKQLASAGQKLLFLPGIDQGSTFVYELSLIRDDNHVSIIPALWHRCDPALIRTRELVRSSSLGRVQLLQFQREIVSESSLVTQADINRALLADIDLLRWLVGDYDQVTALRTGASDAGVLTQSVKLAGKNLPEATWDARASKTSGIRLTIHAEQGIATIELDVQSREWVLTDSNGERLLGNRGAAIRSFLSQLDVGTAGPVEWQELVRGFETVDATGRSVARRRTIDRAPHARSGVGTRARHAGRDGADPRQPALERPRGRTRRLHRRHRRGLASPSRTWSSNGHHHGQWGARTIGDFGDLAEWHGRGELHHHLGD